MKTVQVVVSAVAAVAVAAIVALALRPQKLQPPSPPPVRVDVHIALPEFPNDPKRNEREKELAKAEDTYNAQMKARFDALDAKIEEARRKGDEARANQLAESRDAAAAWEARFQKRMDEIQKWAEENRGLDPSKSPGKDGVPAAPSPVTPDDLPPRDSPAVQDESGRPDDKAVRGMIAAALCVIQPELCPFLGGLLKALGLFGEDKEVSEALAGVAQIVAGGTVSQDQLDQIIGPISRKSPEAAKELAALLEKAKALNPSVKQALEGLAGGVEQDLKAAIETLQKEVANGAVTYGKLSKGLDKSLQSALGSGWVSERRKQSFLLLLRMKLGKELPPAIEKHFMDLPL